MNWKDYVVMVSTGVVAGLFMGLGWLLRGAAHAADWTIGKAKGF